MKILLSFLTACLCSCISASPGPSMKVVLLKDNSVAGRYDSETLTGYVVCVQDIYEIPKDGAKVVLWRASDGKGVIYLKDQGKRNVYSTPDENSTPIGYLEYEEGCVPNTYQCAGYENGWFKTTVNGRNGYIQESYVDWDAIDTF